MPSPASSPAPADIVRFTNGYIALKDGTAIKGDLYVSPSLGAIVSGQNSYYTNELAPVRTIDLDGGLLSPGLIDVQINGAYGVDFSELEPTPAGEEAYLAGLDKVSERILETGTTAYVPTIITQKEELYRKVSARWRTATSGCRRS
jgi:N-acetylglucosamine-6-phosphate deacetylase